MLKEYEPLGGSPGLVVMGGDSGSEGRGFESRCRILDGHFFTLICCKIVLMFVWERPKINEKEAGGGPFFFKIKKKEYEPRLTSVGRQPVIFDETNEPWRRGTGAAGVFPIDPVSRGGSSDRKWVQWFGGSLRRRVYLFRSRTGSEMNVFWIAAKRIDFETSGSMPYNPYSIYIAINSLIPML